MPIERSLLITTIGLIQQRVGLSKYTQNRADIATLLERFSDGNVLAYSQRLRASTLDSAIWQDLIHALTIGETYFLRDKQQFTILRETILPQLIEQRREEGRKLLRLWSAGCATGEEAYSLAITVRALLPDHESWQVDIIGTDINQRAIKAAQGGVYRSWSFRNTPDGFQQQYFDDIDDSLHLREELRTSVLFRRSNVLSGFPEQSCDVVLCRHVLMYFGPDQAKAAEEQLYQATAPGGWLMLGQAEVLQGNRDLWIMHVFPGTTVYQRPSQRFPKSSYRVHITSKSDATPVMTPLAPGSSYQDAVDAIHNDDLKSAEFHLSELLTDHARDPRAHALMAYICANRKAYPEAQAHLHAALKDDPLLADAHYIRALIHIEHDETTEAMAALQAVLYSERKHPLAAHTLGNLQMRVGDTKRAIRAWENALSALEGLDEQAYISDISDITVAALHKLLKTHIENASVSDL